MSRKSSGKDISVTFEKLNIESGKENDSELGNIA